MASRKDRGNGGAAKSGELAGEEKEGREGT